MRLSRRWLAFTPVLPAAGLVLLLRASGQESAATQPRGGPPLRASRGAPRLAGREAATAATGRLEAPSLGTPAETRHEAPRAAAVNPLALALRPLLDKLHYANQEDDERAIAARRAEIAVLVAKNPDEALAALLAELRAASDESEAGTILSVITGQPALPQAELLAALADMARKDELPLHRQVAIHALGELGGVDAARLGDLAELGRRDREPEVRETAAVTLGSVADRSPGPLAQAASRELVQSLGAEADARVRTSLVYAFRDTRDPAAAGALLGALADPDAGVRLAAADMLGDVAAAHRAKAVEQLAAQFASEPQKEVRQTIVTAIVRAGRIAAVPVLEKLRGGDVQELIDDFLVGLRSGEDNMEKLYAVRFAREKARGKPE